MSHSELDRRRLAALLAAGFAAPGVARAAGPRIPQSLDFLEAHQSIVAVIPPKPIAPGETIETSDDPYSRMTAPVMINGQGPFQFVVDTGANQSVISQELAVQLALPAGAPVALHGVAGVDTTPTAIAAHFQIGTRSDPNVLMPVIPQAAMGAQGIIGVDRLKKSRVKLDFGSHALTISSSAPFSQNPNAVVVRATRRGGQLLIVDTDLAGIRVDAFLDTGAERSIGNDALLKLATLRMPQGKFYDVAITSVTGRTIQGQLANIPVLRVGHVRLVNLALTFADLHIFQIWNLDRPAILLGMDALGTFDRVSLDFGRAEVQFELDTQRTQYTAGRVRGATEHP
jgi:predicted aspartyl protease